MREPRLSLISRLPIRWRLALTSAALTFVILCGFAVVVGQLTASRIRSDFNNQLVAAADDLSQRMVISVNTARTRVEVQPPLDVYAAPEHAAIRLLSGAGDELKATKGAPNFGFPVLAGTVTMADYRIAARQVPLQDPTGHAFGTVYVQYARRLSDLEATVRRVRIFLLFGVMAGSALALAGGLLIARRAMAPIALLTATSREIARTRDPNRRVPVPDAEDEVAELARTLDDMLQGLESSRAETAAMLARQRQFVADASHELRTPLTSVLANLELLVDVLDGERGEAARSALRSSRRMRRLVGDLLLLARHDAERSGARKATDLSRAVLEAAGELGPIAADHDLVVDAGDGLVVEGSHDELVRLAVNLMENAIKHTPAGTRVSAVARREGADVVLTVEDDGPGIPEDVRGRLFERFVRGSGDRGGSFGLGLSIVRAVAEGHGGTVALQEPEQGTGAKFVVRLPAAAVVQGAAPGAPRPAEPVV